MNTVKFSGEHGIVIRRASLEERGVSMEILLEAMEGNGPSDQNAELLMFSPIFGQDALDVLSARLAKIGLIYFDDFFDLKMVLPSWSKVEISIVA
ncbi:hypothetical protein [Variovorax sp. DT-64]|uniref:hypothetical protein n=1 Tax=Variovorax sp. DT-64 TaxID=3396160 RepID=UPI003F1BD2E8